MLQSVSAQAPEKLTLASAIRNALANSPFQTAAKADLEGAKASERVARANTGPQISANAFGTSGNNAAAYGSPPMVEPPVWMLVPTGSFLDANLALMVPLFSPRLRSMIDSAKGQSQAAVGDLDEVRADIALAVTDAYDRVLLARQMIRAEESKVAATQELVKTAKAMFDAGQGIEASVQRSQAELSHAERSLTSARNDEAKALIELQAAMNADFNRPIDPSGDLNVEAPTMSLEDSIQLAKKNRGLVVSALARQNSTNSEVRAAQDQRKPQLYGAIMGDATNRSDMGGLSAGLTLSIPIFDGGRINAQVAQARSMRAKATATAKQALISVERDVRQAWLDIATAKANLTSSESAVRASAAAFEVAALRVRAGKAILVEQLDALEALIRAKSDLAQAQFDQAMAIAKLNRAMGAKS